MLVWTSKMYFLIFISIIISGYMFCAFSPFSNELICAFPFERWYWILVFSREKFALSSYYWFCNVIYYGSIWCRLSCVLNSGALTSWTLARGVVTWSCAHLHSWNANLVVFIKFTIFPLQVEYEIGLLVILWCQLVNNVLQVVYFLCFAVVFILMLSFTTKFPRSVIL